MEVRWPISHCFSLFWLWLLLSVLFLTSFICRHLALNWAFVDPKTSIEVGTKFCICVKELLPWVMLPLQVSFVVNDSSSSVGRRGHKRATFGFGSGTLHGHLLASWILPTLSIFLLFFYSACKVFGNIPIWEINFKWRKFQQGINLFHLKVKSVFIQCPIHFSIWRLKVVSLKIRELVFHGYLCYLSNGVQECDFKYKLTTLW